MIQTIYEQLAVQGMYAVATWPSAGASLQEHLRKHAPVHDAFTSPFCEQVATYHVGRGTATQRFTQLQTWLKSTLHEKTIHDYVYMLRSVLYNDSVLRPLFRALERTTPQQETAYEYAATIATTPYTNEQLRTIIDFIETLFELKQLQAQRAKIEPLMWHERLTQCANRTQQRFDTIEQTMTYTNLFSEQPATIPLSSLVMLTEIPANTYELLRQQQIDVAHFVATTTFTAQQVEAFRSQHASVDVILQHALIAYLQHPVETIAPITVKKTTVKAAKTSPKEKELAQQITHLTKQLTELTQQLTHYEQQASNHAQSEQQIAFLYEQLHTLEMRNDALEHAIEQAKQQRQTTTAAKMVTAMQQTLEALQQELATETTNTKQTYIEQIADLRIAFIGGHQNLHQQIAKTFVQDVLCISPEKQQFDVKQLQQYDIVVFITSYASHSLYERAFDYLKRQHMKHKCVVTSQQHLETIARKIYFQAYV